MVDEGRHVPGAAGPAVDLVGPGEELHRSSRELDRAPRGGVPVRHPVEHQIRQLGAVRRRLGHEAGHAAGVEEHDLTGQRASDPQQLLHLAVGQGTELVRQLAQERLAGGRAQQAVPVVALGPRAQGRDVTAMHQDVGVRGHAGQERVLGRGRCELCERKQQEGRQHGGHSSGFNPEARWSRTSVSLRSGSRPRERVSRGAAIRRAYRRRSRAFSALASPRRDSSRSQ